MSSRKRGKKVQHEPPHGKIRRSQVVTTFGPGAMVDLVDQAVLVGGLDYWSYKADEPQPWLPEPRLWAALESRLKHAGLKLDEGNPFKQPPAGGDQAGKHNGVRVLEFPQRFVCQNPKCRRLLWKSDLKRVSGRYFHECGTGKQLRHECVPVRFLGACRRGHCQEWPWEAFAHLDGTECRTPKLVFEEGATGDFSEVIVRCLTCAASQSLVVALKGGKDGGIFKCGGQRPWLGGDAAEPCDESLRLLVRTASNSYFSQVVSALTVDQPGKELEAAVSAHWTTLQNADPSSLPHFRKIGPVGLAIERWSDEQVLAAVKAKIDGETAPRAPLRTAEYEQFLAQPVEEPGERAGDEDFFARRLGDHGALPHVAAVVLATKLREVRAQIGFTRLEPSTPDLQGEYDLAVESAPLGLNTTWLPATEVLGEGVFIQFDEQAITSWEQRPEVRAREKELDAGYAAWRNTLEDASRERTPGFPGARFYLLHSFSHLLISAISLECGYSASAIRERIYCSPPDTDEAGRMAGILLSTGSAGSEGTLGGLVEQGRRLGSHFRFAWDLGRLCAGDPVCAAHSPKGDPSERFLEGAACHGCLFIAETSCERFNRFLDRSLVVPTVGRPKELAFFGERP